MNISLDFARTLLEGDQLALAKNFEEAAICYRRLSVLEGSDAEERALAQSRLSRAEAAKEAILAEAKAAKEAEAAKAAALAQEAEAKAAKEADAAKTAALAQEAEKAAKAAQETAKLAARVETATPEAQSDGLKVVERSLPEQSLSQEAKAEALANDGDLQGAVALYQEIVSSDPDNALALERLSELMRALPTQESPAAAASDQAAHDEVLVATTQRVQEVISEAMGAANWREDLPKDPVAMLETLLARLKQNRRSQA